MTDMDKYTNMLDLVNCVINSDIRCALNPFQDTGPMLFKLVDHKFTRKVAEAHDNAAADLGSEWLYQSIAEVLRLMEEVGNV